MGGIKPIPKPVDSGQKTREWGSGLTPSSQGSGHHEPPRVDGAGQHAERSGHRTRSLVAVPKLPTVQASSWDRRQTTLTTA